MPPEGFHAISGTLSNQQETPQPFEQVLRQTPGTSHEPLHLGSVQWWQPLSLFEQRHC